MCTQMPFFGMLIGADGIKLDTKKAEALKHSPLAGNVREIVISGHCELLK